MTRGQLGGNLRFTLKRGWWLVIVLTLLIGGRYQVGGDWYNYIRNFQAMSYRDLADALTESDPGYRMLEWLGLQYDWGIYGVNLIGAAIFSFGLVVFCRSLPRPWLALTAAVPYLVVVLGMGYTRQGIALGLAMIGLVALGRRSVSKYVFWVLLGATFHKSAVLLLPIAALAATRKRLWTAVWVAVTVAVAYTTLLAESVETLYAGYIDAEYQSQGALVRLAMNAVPAAILLLWRRNFEMNLAQLRLWTWFAMISLALLAGYFVTPASTALDRVALYMLPLQLAVFAYVPEVFGGKQTRNQLFAAAVVAYYALVLFVWLNFATHAQYWIPYRNWLFL
ncbi:MAG: EpsG family protein [Wenzhouxiangella sp.]